MKKIETEKNIKIVKTALKEDLGTGDITSNLTIPEDQKGVGIIIAKQKGVIVGLEVARIVFKQFDPNLIFKSLVSDGAEVKTNQKVALIRGRVKSILATERTALNFLGRLSGIATLTNRFVFKVKQSSVKIFDTRKTTPGLRVLEKYAVALGGGHNHRMGLWDGILIKDNHLAGLLHSGIKDVVKNVIASATIMAPSVCLSEFIILESVCHTISRSLSNI